MESAGFQSDRTCSARSVFGNWQFYNGAECHLAKSTEFKFAVNRCHRGQHHANFELDASYWRKSILANYCDQLSDSADQSVSNHM